LQRVKKSKLTPLSEGCVGIWWASGIIESTWISVDLRNSSLVK
jgi:hypothetical protein